MNMNTRPSGKRHEPCWPAVAIVIPHWKGADLLHRCLEALQQSAYTGPMDTVVVNNACPDGSIGVVQQYPFARVVHSTVNRGYAGGCNWGIRHSNAPYVVLLNNDAVVTPGWLNALVQCMEHDAALGAVQPKVLSIDRPDTFDYAGGAGGEMDILGYPYVRGRLFDTLERDEGQYDTATTRIFWASGAACLLRRSVLNQVGLLEEAYFAHMEEIDLHWRMQWAGYTVAIAPDAVVYHQAGSTLKAESVKKMMLNHRNNLVMLCRNYSLATLSWVLPLRLILEGVTALWALFTGRGRRTLAIGLALLQWPLAYQSILRGRRLVSQTRKVNECQLLHRLYRGASPLAYYLKKSRSARDLKIG